ncbi:hypothetical protein HDU99_000309, partial [Rhizoclosmatium hyalinum]
PLLHPIRIKPRPKTRIRDPVRVGGSLEDKNPRLRLDETHSRDPRDQHVVSRNPASNIPRSETVLGRYLADTSSWVHAAKPATEELGCSERCCLLCKVSKRIG